MGNQGVLLAPGTKATGTMEIWWKAAGTAVTMALVILMARRAHRRLAGLVAAFPTVTAPALLWLARDQGPAFAAAAAVATIAGCVMQAGFALGYARGARHFRPAPALGCGLAAAAALAAVALFIDSALAPATLAAIAGVVLCKCLLPAAGRDASRHACAPRAAPKGGMGEVLLTVLASALLSTLAASLGADWGPMAAGLLASLPVVCGTVAMVEHARHGQAAAGEFLHAYVNGLFGRVLFGLLFALAAPAWGAAWALLLATAASMAASVASSRLAGLGVPPATRLAPRR